MKLENALNLIAPHWRKDYLRFIETGEAPKEFLSYVDQDSSAQEAVEMAFNAQADAFEGLARELRGTSSEETVAVTASVAASDKLAEAFEVVLQLPKEERLAVVVNTASTLGRVLQPEQQRTAHSVAQKLENALANTTCVPG